jgi:hypothetical protein
MTTPNERVAAEAERILQHGAMGNLGARRDDYEAWLDAAYGQGAIVRTIATSCAIFAGGCLINSGVQSKRSRPKAPAITTWLGVRGFVDSWVGVGSPGFRVQRGDILYWSGGTAATWKAATNGHVGIALAGAGDMWLTAEGGGSPGGTMCRMSAAAKNITASSGRPLRGVWRPDLMQAGLTLPAPAPVQTWRDIKPGMRGEDVRAWQRSLLRWRPECLPKFGADGVYGTALDGETLAATKAFQMCRGLPSTGIVDRQTWDAGEPA